MAVLDFLRTPRRAPGECIVHFDDVEIADLYPFLIEVSVDTARGEAAEATLRFETRRDIDGRWIVQDDARVQPWKRVRIEAAFGDETEEVMRGFIREVRVDFPDDSGAAEVTVVAQDESLALDREHKRRPWGVDAPTSDAVIVQAIVADEHGLGFEEAPATGQVDLANLNQDATDIAFLKLRAEANDYELIFREGAVYFGPMRLEGEAQDPILVYAGASTNCSSISIQDDGHRPDRVAYEVAASTGSETRSETVLPNLTLLGPEPASSEANLDDRFVWRTSRQGVSDETRARAIAQQRANRESMKVKARGELDGARYGHVLKVGRTVGVDGVGTRHSGLWYVDRVTHTFDATGYRERFELLRNAHGDNLASSTSVLARVLS